MTEYEKLMYDLGKKKNLSTKRLEKEMLKFYRDSYYQYQEQLSRVKRNSMKEVWLRNQIQSVSDNMKKISRQYEDLLTKEMKDIISSIDKTNEACFNRIAKRSGLPSDLFTNTFNSINEDVIREMKAGKIYQDGVGLSKRIWKDHKSFDKSIHDIMTEGLRDGLSVYDISKNLAQYLNPDDKKPGKYPKSSGRKSVDYNSYRLANTTITHTYQRALDRVNKSNPFMNGIKWVGGHNDNSCEVCKKRNGVIYAAKNPEPWFDITAEPLPLDHPNGLCINIPYIEDDYEAIGRRLYLWSEGKEDPELDKWFEENGDKYKTAEQVKAEKERKAQEKVRNDAWVDKNFKHMKDQMEEYWDDIRHHIKKAPPHIQDWWAKGSKHFNYAGPDGDKAYYHPRYKHIKMDMTGEKTNRRNPYTTFFHESGHLIDNTLNPNNPKFSRSETFYQAIVKDYEDLLRRNASPKMWDLKPDIARRQAESTVARLLKGSPDSISAVSDIIGGLTDNKVKGLWGHTTEYWNRGNKANEITSEMWAHMSSCWANDENLRVMQEYFPSALKEWEKLIAEQMK